MVEKEKYYPKVLIIGQTFNKYNGGGITMTNLFTGWPQERIALCSIANIMADLDASICSKYFQLSYNGKLHPFPLNVILPKVKCGAFTVAVENAVNDETLKPIQQPGKYKKIYNLIANMLHLVGLFNVFYKLKITPEFLEWINDFKPDAIYTQLSTLEMIRFVSDVHDKTGIPVVVHIMDDWPSTIDKPGLLYGYWKKVTDKAFRALLGKSAFLMSIGDAMSEEYSERYGGKWTAFHNTLDLNRWLPAARTSWEGGKPFRILYAGRLGFGVVNSVVDIAEAVNDQELIDIDMVFELQTPDIDFLKGKVELGNRIKSVGMVDYADLPTRFSGADVLVLPYDFDAKSIGFLQFSFPTKVIEYMACGTPILIYADKRTSLNKMAVGGNFAYIVEKRDKKSLVNAIKDLYSDKKLREKLGKAAQRIAIEREDSVKVRDDFRKSFEVVMQTNKSI